MIPETIVILVLMVVDFPFTLTPATVWGLSLGLSAVQLLSLYILATIIGGIIFYPSMKKRAKKFRTWKVIKKYKSRGTFYSVFVANMLAHNFDTYAAVAEHKLNVFTATLALIVSNAIYFFTVLGMIYLLSLLFSDFVLQIIVSTVVVSAVWTFSAHYVLNKMGFGW